MCQSVSLAPLPLHMDLIPLCHSLGVLVTFSGTGDRCSQYGQCGSEWTSDSCQCLSGFSVLATHVQQVCDAYIGVVT